MINSTQQRHAITTSGRWVKMLRYAPIPNKAKALLRLNENHELMPDNVPISGPKPLMAKK